MSITDRTAVYGPVRTVVWEGRSRKAPPYPDLWRKADLCLGRFFELVDLTLVERVDRGRVPGNIDSRV